MSTNGEVKKINIAYIGGGSRGWAWGFMSDLASESGLSGTVRLYDIDNEAAKSNEIIGNMIRQDYPDMAQWAYQQVDSLEEALTGVDFVVLSILPGTFDDMDIDVHYPEKYGIYQSVGDSVGVGGLFRSMRTIPMYKVIGEAIRDHAPQAWVINYTNPMTVCVRTLYSVFPEIKAFGCCHEVFGTQKLLAEALAEETGGEKVSRDEIKVSVNGINHFTWLTSASYKDKDLMPIYDAFVRKHFESGYEYGETGNWMNDFFSSAHRVKFDLFLRYGVIAAAGDRHLVEFVDNSWYLKDEATIKKWKFSLTPVSWRKSNLEERKEKSTEMISGKKGFDIKETGEEGVKQIKALLGLADLITNVNFPNKGQTSFLKDEAVVETNVLMTRDKIIPLLADPLPEAIESLIQQHSANQEMIVQAGLTNDKEKAFQAFLNDPQVHMDPKEAKACFDEMADQLAMFNYA